MHVVVIYTKYENLDDDSRLNPHGADQMRETVRSVSEALTQAGHRVTKIEASVSLLEEIRALDDVDVIFNLSAGITNKRFQANFVGMLEMLGIPLVGSGLSTHIMGLHKEVTKIILREAGIPTARSQVFQYADTPVRDDFVYPLIVKPEHEGSSVGVDASSYVEDTDALRTVVREKMDRHRGAILAEEFLPGREFTVGVLGNTDPEVLPVKEYVYDEDSDTKFLTVQAKADDTVRQVCPAELDGKLKARLEELARRAFLALRCRGFARVDFRLDADGEPKVLELNTLPGLQKNYSDFPNVAQAGGISYEELIQRLVDLATKDRGAGV